MKEAVAIMETMQLQNGINVFAYSQQAQCDSQSSRVHGENEAVWR